MHTRCLVTSLILAVLPVVTVGQEWQFDTVDNSGDAGQWTSIAADAQGRPHIVYFTVLGNTYPYAKTMYASWTGTGWTLTELAVHGPNASLYGPCAVTIDSHGSAHVVWVGEGYNGYYYDRTIYLQSQDANGVWSASQAWYTNTQPNTLPHGLAVAISGEPDTPSFRIHVLDAQNDYYIGERLIDFIFDPTTASWTTIVVDPTSGYWPSATTDDQGHIHVSYHSLRDQDLKYAYFDGTRWATRVIAGADGTDVGRQSSITVQDHSVAHIAYYDGTQQRLMHAELTLPLAGSSR